MARRFIQEAGKGLPQNAFAQLVCCNLEEKATIHLKESGAARLIFLHENDVQEGIVVGLATSDLKFSRRSIPSLSGSGLHSGPTIDACVCARDSGFDVKSLTSIL